MIEALFTLHQTLRKRWIQELNCQPIKNRIWWKRKINSVGSVTLELLSRVIKPKEVIPSDMHNKILKFIKIWSHNSIYGILKVLSLGLKDCLRTQSTSKDLCFNSGDVTLLHGPGTPSMSPGHKIQRPTSGSLEPLEPHTNWAQGAPFVLRDNNSPH
ncbi:hypothetical protein O181_019714 [Austropuccinia psidii MF-1]|uniref:Uncharacterized protein n=1 Tax=Austropuccinia psidii MF-1 TaxID=1389203 RepID=A0A9Q3C7L7_9BASI|nr:hypothetical protein [Austropuccinia psidii MF-1]